MTLSAIDVGDPNGDETFKEVFDFSSPEDVLIYVTKDTCDREKSGGWKNFRIEEWLVINCSNPDVTGAASYEQCYGGFLDYTIESLIDCPGEGWFVVEKVTGHYFKGEWGFTDDDMDFYFENVRAATKEEIEQHDH